MIQSASGAAAAMPIKGRPLEHRPAGAPMLHGIIEDLWLRRDPCRFRLSAANSAQSPSA